MGADEAVVATTAKAGILLTSYGFYGRCTVGCPWVSEYTPSKYPGPDGRRHARSRT